MNNLDPRKMAFGFCIVFLLLFILKKSVVFLILSVLVLLLNLFFPKIIQFLVKNITILFSFLGNLLNLLLLTLIYWSVVILLGLLYNIFSSKEINKQFSDRSINSYWIKREKKSFSKEYFQEQF